MDTLLIIILALTTVAIPALTETAAAFHIFDACSLTAGYSNMEPSQMSRAPSEYAGAQLSTI
jgi:hypothetical protein